MRQCAVLGFVLAAQARVWIPEVEQRRSSCRMRSKRAPMQRQGDVGIARKVGAMDCAQFDASPGMDCRRTPGVALRSRRAGRLHGLQEVGAAPAHPALAAFAHPCAAQRRSSCRARRSLYRGGLLLTPGSCPSPCGPATPFALLLQRSGAFLLATQEKDSRSPEASEIAAGMPRDNGACSKYTKSQGSYIRRGGEFVRSARTRRSPI